MRIFVLFGFLALFCGFAFAGIEMTFPEKSSLEDQGSVEAGSVSPGQSFDIVFSDNSGRGFEWDSIEVLKTSLPQGWSVSRPQITDSSLALTLWVPVNSQEQTNVLRVRLSNSSNIVSEVIGVVVSVKKNLVNFSFSRVSPDKQYSIGDKIKYGVSVSNSSIGSDSAVISANLPSNWFSPKRIDLKPKESVFADLEVIPQNYGKRAFVFSGLLTSRNAYVGSFESEVEVAPTLKGKFSAPSSGFPFFTFSLLPFQLIDSVIAELLK